jgi:hypothetical protein
MSQKSPQVDIHEANLSNRSPSQHEGSEEGRGGRLARPQLYQALYPSPFRVGLTIFALLITVLCVALDSTIVSTAIPRITDDFHNLNDIGWYGSGKLHHLHQMIYLSRRLRRAKTNEVSLSVSAHQMCVPVMFREDIQSF